MTLEEDAIAGLRAARDRLLGGQVLSGPAVDYEKIQAEQRAEQERYEAREELRRSAGVSGLQRATALQLAVSVWGQAGNRVEIVDGAQAFYAFLSAGPTRQPNDETSA
jgi:hypothetical protein